MCQFVYGICFIPIGLGALEGAGDQAVVAVVGGVGVALLPRDGVVADGAVVVAVRGVGVAAHPAVGRPVVALGDHSHITSANFCIL